MAPVGRKGLTTANSTSRQRLGPAQLAQGQGGDEFSILAPGTGQDGALLLASRLRDAVATATSGSLTTSVGWVIYPAHAEAPSTLLALADADLRRAKPRPRATGRERAADPRVGISRSL